MGTSPHAIASGKLSIPWPRWPTRLSLFHPGSRSAQQLAEPPRTDSDEAAPPIPSTNPSPDRYPPSPPPPPTEHGNQNRGAIQRLMQSPVLYDPLRAPRFPIVLCHGAPAPLHVAIQRFTQHLVSSQGYTASTSAAHRACVCSTGRPSLASSARSSAPKSSSPRCPVPARSLRARSSSTGSCRSKPQDAGSTSWHTRWAGSTAAI